MIPFEAHLKTVFALGTPLSKIVRVNYFTGVRYLEYYLNPIMGERHLVVAVMCVVRDATQQHIAETIQQQLTVQYLNEAQRLQQIIDASPVAIITIDCDGYVTAINQAAVEMSPHLKASFKFDFSRSDVHCAENDNDQIVFERALKGEKIVAYPYQHNNKYYLISASPTRDKETGAILGAVAFYQDVTEQEKLRQEMNRLDRLNLIGEMAAGVAHEIRNPMTVVQGYLQMLSRQAEAKTLEKYEIIMEELNRISEIVTDFLTVARNKVVQKSHQNINDIIENLYPLIQTDAIKHNVSVELALQRDIPELYLNDKEIRQLILNLVRNGIEAITTKGKLTLETKLVDSMVELTIADTGCGIPQEIMHKIFDPFFTTKDHGTGLGLAVCLGIVERHGGKIEVASPEGMGTRIVVLFPQISCSDNAPNSGIHVI
jgi:two-component system, sporulation sensor kinase E